MIARPASMANCSKMARTALSSDAGAAFVEIFCTVTFNQPFLYDFHHLFWRTVCRLKPDLGIFRRFIGRVDAGEVPYLALKGPRVKPLRVAPHAFLERRINEHLDEFAIFHQFARHTALGP